MTTGLAIFDLSPALSVGTVKVRARVTDSAGNEGTTSTSTVVVSSSGSSFTTTDVTQSVDPLSGDALLQRGNVTTMVPLDLAPIRCQDPIRRRKGVRTEWHFHALTGAPRTQNSGRGLARARS